jgi:hypothetical protein
MTGIRSWTAEVATFGRAERPFQTAHHPALSRGLGFSRAG